MIERRVKLFTEKVEDDSQCFAVVISSAHHGKTNLVIQLLKKAQSDLMSESEGEKTFFLAY